MVYESPAVILFDQRGNPLACSDGYDLAPVVDQKGLIVAGQTSTGKVRFFSVGNNGALNVISATSGRNIVGEYLIGTNLLDGYTSAQNLLSLENPVGSNRIIYLSKALITGTVISPSSIIFSYTLSRTIGLPSLGSVIISQKRASTDLAAVGIVRLSPDAVVDSGIMWATTVGVGNVDSFSNMFSAVNTELERHEIVLNAGEGILISCGANSPDWFHWINLVWCEEAL